MPSLFYTPFPDAHRGAYMHVAHLVEQSTRNRCVAGSIPVTQPTPQGDAQQLRAGTEFESLSSRSLEEVYTSIGWFDPNLLRIRGEGGARCADRLARAGLNDTAPSELARTD